MSILLKTMSVLSVLSVMEGISKSELKISVVSNNVIKKLGKEEFVALDSLLKIAKTFNVDIGNIVSMKGGK